MHHVAATFALLAKYPDLNILESFSRDDFKLVPSPVTYGVR